MHYKKYIFIFVLSITLVSSLFSQQIDTLSATTCSKKEFSNWYKQELEIRRKKPLLDLGYLNNVVLKRINLGYYLSDEEILNLALTNASNESVLTFKDRTGFKFLHKNVLILIDTLKKLNEDRPLLITNLLLLKHDLFEVRNNNEDNQVKKQVDSTLLSNFDSLQVFIFLQKNKVNLSMGEYFLLKKKDSKKAELYYKEVMRFPFFNIKEKNYDTAYRLRCQYVFAAKSIIECNRGNLKSLNRLEFIPSIQDQVYPILKDYIEEMGGKWDR
jgi:hypothetical protein